MYLKITKGRYILEKKQSRVVIGIFLLVIAVMAIGYTVLATQLKFKSKHIKWDIKVESVFKNKSLTLNALENTHPLINGTFITFDVSLKPGSKILYDVIIKNVGTIDAVLESITGEQSRNQNDNIKS